MSTGQTSPMVYGRSRTPLPAPLTPDERQFAWGSTLFMAVQFYTQRINHPDDAVAERSAQALFDLEKTRLRHNCYLSDVKCEDLDDRRPLLRKESELEIYAERQADAAYRARRAKKAQVLQQEAVPSSPVSQMAQPPGQSATLSAIQTSTTVADPVPTHTETTVSPAKVTRCSAGQSVRRMPSVGLLTTTFLRIRGVLRGLVPIVALFVAMVLIAMVGLPSARGNPQPGERPWADRLEDGRSSQQQTECRHSRHDLAGWPVFSFPPRVSGWPCRMSGRQTWGVVMAGRRVVLAMSGGVDSSASAVLLQRQGYDVIGLFMRTGVHTEEPDHRRENKKGCCSAVDAGDARRIADKLDIPFYALDFEHEFGQIIDYFTDEYLKGRTPNPCVVCNNWLKFGQLWQFGQKLGADFIATGHYARVLRGADGHNQLHKGYDPEKDQSYVLHGIKREVLDHLMFPVGGFHKAQIRAIAAEAGFTTVAAKPDSVEICFVPSGNHVDVVRSRRPEAVTAGRVVDTAGDVLGEHDGIDRFTIGQRKGLGVGGGGKKRFVLDILPDTNTVVVGDEDQLLARGLTASRINWLIDPPTEPLRVTAKIRYRHAGCPATITATPDGGAEVQFDQPTPAVTPGQAVTFYDATRVLGGGWIESAVR